MRANLQEGRHSLARKIFHGRAGQLYQRYQEGMEDHIGALGLVLNALVAVQHPLHGRRGREAAALPRQLHLADEATRTD